MGEITAIGWCNHTFNPWVGCTKVSDGCKHCYAEVLMDKRYHKVQWGPQGTRVRTSAANWKQPLRWDRQARRDGIRRKVFCASLADVFEDHSAIAPEWREDLWNLIEKTPNLDWLLLTKRPENVLNMVPVNWLLGESGRFWQPNVWIGTTVENQAMADKRIPILLNIPASVRFLSIEPMVGPVDLKQSGAFWTSWRDNSITKTTRAWQLINWVICGGESGVGARPMDVQWARDLRDQCTVAGIPYFFKQWGSNGGDQEQHHGGDLLDGQQWHQFPVFEVNP